MRSFGDFGGGGSLPAGTYRARVVQVGGTSDAAAHLLHELPEELLAVVCEQLSFKDLRAAYGSCRRLQYVAPRVTRIIVDRVSQLRLPLLRPFGASLRCLEVENASSSWVPQLSCVMGALPALQRLFIRRRKDHGAALLPFSEPALLSLVGALDAGACPGLHHLNLDERLAEDKVALLAGAMRPSGGLLFAASHGHESVVAAMLERRADVETCLEDGASALLVASYHADPSIVSRLLVHGASVHASRADGVSALIMSSNRGHLPTVEVRSPPVWPAVQPPCTRRAGCRVAAV